MSRDKQISEMAKEICSEYDCIIPCQSCSYYGYANCRDVKSAEKLYDAGYRKSTDLAEEIFAEIEKIIDKHYNRHIFGVEDLSDVEQEAVMNFSGDVTYDIAELKKKYTERSENGIS